MNRSASAAFDSATQPMSDPAVSNGALTPSRTSILIERPAVTQFLEPVRSPPAEPSQAPTPQPVVFHLYGVRGVGKSTLLADLSRSIKGNLATLSFAEAEQISSPIPLMVRLFEELTERNHWIFKPKFLVMYERYAKALQELQTVPLPDTTEVSELQLHLCKTLMEQGSQFNLFVPDELSMAASVAQANLNDKIETLLHQHPATQHDQALQNLLRDPLTTLTTAFAEALQKRSKRQPIVIILDGYEKASVAIDVWFWHLLLTQPAFQNSGVKIVMASQTSLLARRGWQRLQHHRPEPEALIVEHEVEPFDLDQTRDFWQQVNPSGDQWSARELFVATNGLPYALNLAHQQLMLAQHEPSPDESDTYAPEALLESSPSIQPPSLPHLLEQGFSLVQRYLVQLAACCRSFNRDLIEYLLTAQDSNFVLAVQAECNGFEWLIQQNFVEQVEGCWRLDDLTRNHFRESLKAADPELFCSVQQQLADYFLARSNEIISLEASPRQQYASQVWQRGRAEYLYHLMLAQHPQAASYLLQHLLEGHYFDEDSITQEIWTTLTSEYPLVENPFLDKAAQDFLQHIEPAITLGSLILDREAIPYEQLEETFSLWEEEVDRAVQACLHPDEIPETPLAQFVRLFYESKQCLAGEQVDYVEQAEAIADHLANEADPEFSAQLFLWKLGDRYSSLGAYEEAIAAYEKALEYQPENAAAWDNRGSSLGCLERYDEAIASFDKALELTPEAHDVWHSRGLALAKAERYDEAIASFEQALDIKPYKHEPWYDKACCYAIQHQPTLALESLEQAISLNPKYQTMAQQDPDLASLKDTLTFERLITSNLTPQSLDQ